MQVPNTVCITIASVVLLSCSASNPVGRDAAPQHGSPPVNIDLSAVTFLPSTHHGDWRGDNRLWVMDPETPYRSTGTSQVTPNVVRYTWAHEGEQHTGEIVLSGQPAALQARWTDTWHAKEPMILNGFAEQGRITLYGTYSAGEYGVWGWQIEIDVQDRESFFLRMRNVVPGLGPVPAVIFHGTR